MPKSTAYVAPQSVLARSTSAVARFLRPANRVPCASAPSIVDKIYYANDRVDAAAIGFDDEFIYREFDLSPADRHKPMVPLLREEGKKAFAMWAQSDSKTEY